MAISRLFMNFRRNLLFPDLHRSFSLSSAKNIKEIRVTQEGNTTIVEGVLKPHPKEHLLLKPSENGACPLCAAGVDLKHTDVLIIKQFLRSDGCMLPRRVTGLCYVQQKRVGIMASMAHKAGLLPNLKPNKGFVEPRKRKDYKAYNTYYDEDTIKQRYY